MLSSDLPRYFRRKASDANSIESGSVAGTASELETGVSDSQGDLGIAPGPLVPAPRFAPNRADIDVTVPDDDPNHCADDPVAASGLDDDLPRLFYLLKLLRGQRHCSRLRARTACRTRHAPSGPGRTSLRLRGEQPRSGPRSGGAGLGPGRHCHRRPGPGPAVSATEVGQVRIGEPPRGEGEDKRDVLVATWTQLSTPWTLSTQVG